MIEFEEPGDEFDFEKIKKANLSVRIRTITLFVVFILVIVFLVRNDYNFNFFKTTTVGIEEFCDPSLQYVWSDEEMIYMGKANTVLEQNHEQLQELDGFHSATVEKEPIGYKGADRPVIKLLFEGRIASSLKIKERLCGYRVLATFK